MHTKFSFREIFTVTTKHSKGGRRRRRLAHWRPSCACARVRVRVRVERRNLAAWGPAAAPASRSRARRHPWPLRLTCGRRDGGGSQGVPSARGTTRSGVSTRRATARRRGTDGGNESLAAAEGRAGRRT